MLYNKDNIKKGENEMYIDRSTFEDLINSYDYLIKNEDDAIAAIDFVSELLHIESEVIYEKFPDLYIDGDEKAEASKFLAKMANDIDKNVFDEDGIE